MKRLSAADAAALKGARDAELVDYETVWRIKQTAFTAQFERFRAYHLGTGSNSGVAFETFRRDGGQRLEDFALFEALSNAMVDEGRPCGWHGWPEDFKDKNGSAVHAFREQNGDRVLFHAWLQWIAHRQLARVQQRARRAGMRIGLYLDLAVGVAPDGADTWRDPDTVLRGVRIGCPPDAFNARGQDWGLAPISPLALRSDHGQAFADMIASAMRSAGAVRIDHVMSLMRLYLIADGLDSTDGAYVHYPLREMLAALGAASRQRRRHRHRRGSRHRAAQFPRNHA